MSHVLIQKLVQIKCRIQSTGHSYRCVSWKQAFCCDLPLPSGSRDSSYHKQCIGNYIYIYIYICIYTYIHIYVYIYFFIYWHCMDLLVVCTLKIPQLSGLTGTLNTATKTLFQQLRDLGQPEAEDEAQLPY